MLPFRFTKIGKWWYRGDEIDLVAINEHEKKALFVEVKWRNLSKREVAKLLQKLREKADTVGLDDCTKYYGMIARRAEFKQLFVWDLGDFDLLNKASGKDLLGTLKR